MVMAVVSFRLMSSLYLTKKLKRFLPYQDFIDNAPIRCKKLPLFMKGLDP